MAIVPYISVYYNRITITLKVSQVMYFISIFWVHRTRDNPWLCRVWVPWGGETAILYPIFPVTEDVYNFFMIEKGNHANI